VPVFRVLSGWSANGNYPETDLEEINGNVLEQNFWAGIASGWQRKLPRLKVARSSVRKAAN
jgi:hypothetical protein